MRKLTQSEHLAFLEQCNDNASVVTDNRFAVINGRLFDLTTYEMNDGSVHFVVTMYDADEVMNATYINPVHCMDANKLLDVTVFDTQESANEYFLEQVRTLLEDF